MRAARMLCRPHPPLAREEACPRQNRNTRHRGQVLPIVLFGLLLAGAVLTLMFNAGRKVTEKSLVANAADAAAYSGAVWTARHLNFMAYTNRAMIANHAAVGHFVSYVSWVRYLHDTIEFIDQVTQWIPYVGQYIDIVEMILEQVRDVTEETAEFVVPAIDGWNANYRAAQLEAQASLALDNLQRLMEQTAAVYDPVIRINDRSALDSLPSELRTVLQAQVIGQMARVPTFVERYTAGDDNNAIVELIQASLNADADVRRWISGQRGWQENLLAVQIRKRGNTAHEQSGSGADWQAEDEIQMRTRGLFGWNRWTRLGYETSSASATEFHSDYSGVPQYYNVAGAPGDRSLRIAAIATKQQTQIRTADLLGFDSNPGPLAVAAQAAVEFSRPRGTAFASLGSGRREYASLFNPFWEARLVPLEFIP